MGIFLIISSSLFFSLGGYFGKVVVNTTEMNALITSFSRYALGAILMFIYMVLSKKSFIPNKIGPITKRAAFNSAAVILSTLALNYTTLTNANILHLTYPVFVVVLAPFVTKERPAKSVYLYLVLIFIGSYIISNPDFTNINLGDFAAFASAIFAGLGFLYLTESRKTESGSLIVFYVMLMGTISNGLLVIKDLGLIRIDTIGIVLLAALSGFLGQIFITQAYKYLDSAKGAMLSMSRIVFTALLGYFLLSEPLSLRIMIGIAIITSALIGLSGYFKLPKMFSTNDL